MIEAIFFDIGDTLRTRVPDAALKQRAEEELVRLLGLSGSPRTVCDRVAERHHAYHQWSQDTLVEVREKELWTRWLVPDLPRARIEPIVHALTYWWRLRGGHPVLRPQAPAVIAELSRRGYQLGIISNTICELETPEMLKTHGLDAYFETVILSAVAGCRKPGRAIFEEATRAMGVEPKVSAYVGDRPSRDVAGPRAAGWGMTVILENARACQELMADPTAHPDALIRCLSELPKLFLPRPTYSTMDQRLLF